jgi:hypothetical protein
MWRWIIRAYVSLMVFLVLLFVSVVVFKEVAHLLTWAGYSRLPDWFGEHTLLTALLAGVMAGQVPVDSRLTGEGWFRSKDGKSFEGFKLEVLRRWTWLLLSPLFLIGITVWWFQQDQSAFSSSAVSGIYHELLARNCSNVWARKYWFDNSCNIQMVLIAPWMASIGYSLAPTLRRCGSLILHGSRNSGEAGASPEEGQGNLVKKADLQ